MDDLRDVLADQFLGLVAQDLQGLPVDVDDLARGVERCDQVGGRVEDRPVVALAAFELDLCPPAVGDVHDHADQAGDAAVGSHLGRHVGGDPDRAARSRNQALFHADGLEFLRSPPPGPFDGLAVFRMDPGLPLLAAAAVLGEIPHLAAFLVHPRHGAVETAAEDAHRGQVGQGLVEILGGGQFLGPPRQRILLVLEEQGVVQHQPDQGAGQLDALEHRLEQGILGNPGKEKQARHVFAGSQRKDHHLAGADLLNHPLDLRSHAARANEGRLLERENVLGQIHHPGPVGQRNGLFGPFVEDPDIGVAAARPGRQQQQSVPRAGQTSQFATEIAAQGAGIVRAPQDVAENVQSLDLPAVAGSDPGGDDVREHLRFDSKLSVSRQ